MIDIKDKKDCCGCGACYQACPKNCITMEADKEGFLYPKVQLDLCINCKICEKTCPILNLKAQESIKEGVCLINNDTDVRLNSASGGSFSILAQYVIERKGNVYGAAYDQSMNVIIKRIDKLTSIYELLGSKYVQSDTQNIYKEVETDLRNNLLVLYSGTPCQINGLINFLKKDYKNLITFDFACHGVPSPKVFKKYITTLETKYKKKIIDYKFRTKIHGYNEKTCDYAMIKFQDGKEIYACEAGIEEMFMTKAFFSEISSRPSCSKCAFKGINHIADFTAFDCWHVKDICPKLNDDKGVTSLIINTNKGKTIFEQIKTNTTFVKIDLNKAISLDGISLIYSIPANPQRNNFFNDIENKNIETLYHLYIKERGRRKIKKFIKKILDKFGLSTYLRNLKYKIQAK